MEKRIICIECPKGCAIRVKDENGKLIITGNECPKGEKYARNEVECPTRILTTTVLTDGLKERTVSVKTDKPVPKDKIQDVMAVIHKIRIKNPVRVGDVLIRDILNLNVNLIATREVF